MINNDMFMLFKISLVTFLLSACCADRFGLNPGGDTYEVSCKVVIDYDENGVPISEEIIEKQPVCGMEPPDGQLMIRACNAVVMKNSEDKGNYETAYPNFEVTFVEPVSSEKVDGRCTFFSDDQIIDSSSSMLVDEYIVSDSISDWTQADNKIDPMLGKSTNINSTAEITSSQVTVGAKFLAWRYAKTSARGEINFDRSNCGSNGECDIVVRNIDLSMDDFIIERPTVFARDISVKNTRLYTQGSYKARVDSNGFFKIDNVSTIVSSVIDDEQINLLNSRRIAIYGHFNNTQQGQNHAASSVRIFIFVDNDDYIIYTDSVLDVSKFPTKLANGDRQDVCLTGGPYNTSKDAIVTDCSYKVPNQVWSFEKNGQHLRIRQKMTNLCLNVKPPIPTINVANPFPGFGGYQNPIISLPGHNFDGDVVSIVSCSDSPDQLWSLGPSNEVTHINTDKCLGVEENVYRSNQDSVTVSDCNSKSNAAQRWFLNRPG